MALKIYQNRREKSKKIAAGREKIFPALLGRRQKLNTQI
jgi:hypothetical protein